MRGISNWYEWIIIKKECFITLRYESVTNFTFSLRGNEKHHVKLLFQKYQVIFNLRVDVLYLEGSSINHVKYGMSFLSSYMQVPAVHKYQVFSCVPNGVQDICVTKVAPIEWMTATDTEKKVRPPPLLLANEAEQASLQSTRYVRSYLPTRYLPTKTHFREALASNFYQMSKNYHSTRNTAKNVLELKRV